nr:hypothetical protein [uncultured Albidiferax sp.]
MNDAVIGFLGVLVGAGITVVKDLIFARRAKREAAEYLAIRIVTAMDLFVEGCTAVMFDDGLCEGQKDESDCLQIQTSAPEFHIHLLDGEWKALPTNLMYEILSFPNLVSAAEHQVKGAFDYGGPPYDEGFEERQFQYTALGLKGVHLANEFRQAFKIPLRDYTDWNPFAHLTERMRELVLLREKKAEANQKLNNEMSALFSVERPSEK